MNGSSSVLSAMIVAGLCFPVSADVLLDQPHDFRYGPRSEWLWNHISPQRGDDYQPAGRVIVESVTFWMVATWAHAPDDWAFSVHRSTDESSFWEFAPEYPWFFERTGPSEVVDLGRWNDEADRHLYEVRFDDLDLSLDPADTEKGVFWFSAFGHITNANTQFAGWGTSGNGDINGWYAWWKTMPWIAPGWAGFTLPDGSFTDLAMRIEGTPVPVPGAVIPFAMLALRRRRGR